jgi:uncharacterized protein YdhG (YjbR/CyaY superfamily)
MISDFKNHAGFYPRWPGIKAFQKKQSAYENEKGSILFKLPQFVISI